jgi:hypothetical protein
MYDAQRSRRNLWLNDQRQRQNRSKSMAYTFWKANWIAPSNHTNVALVSSVDCESALEQSLSNHD